MEDAEENKILRRNLADGGCGGQTVDRFLNFHRDGKKQGALRLRNVQRAALLDALHGEPIRIECLDHLIPRIQNQSNCKETV